MKAIIVFFLFVLTCCPESFGLNCECGLEQVSSRIIDGRTVRRGRYPWIASILSPVSERSFALCTGSLINDRFILTAASCFTNPLSLDVSKIVVTLNVYSKSEYVSMADQINPQGNFGTSDSGHKLSVDTLFVNPNYEPLKSGNIALLRLSNPVTFNDTFSPICLASFDTNEHLFAVGFGQTSLSSEIVSDRLNEALISKINYTNCNQIFKEKIDPNGELSENILCGNGDPGILSGDFGGPLSVRANGRVYQTGVSSHYFLTEDTLDTFSVTLHGHAPSNKIFDAFEKIQPHLMWIDSVTKDTAWCSGKYQAITSESSRSNPTVPTQLFQPIHRPSFYPSFRPVPVPVPVYNNQMVPKRPSLNRTMSRKPMMARKQPSRLTSDMSTNYSCECGLEVPSTRIINGKPVKVNQYPWMVSILSSNDGSNYGMCGGSLINDRFILTAAHCLATYQDVSKMVVTLGSITKEDRFNRPNLRVESIHIHPEYIADGEINDIALIKLMNAVSFNHTVKPICLPLFLDQENLFVTGWGLTSNGFDPITGMVHLKEAKILQEVGIKEVDMITCKIQYSNVDVLKDICAGGEVGGTCLGDSGGPLSTRMDGHVYQVGVTSFGAVDCGVISKSPNVFERTAPHLAWIGEVTNPSNWCNAKYQAITNN